MSFEGRSMRATCHGCLRPTPRKTRLYRLGGRVDGLTRSRRVQNRRRNVTSTPPCDSDSPSAAAAVTASPSDSEIKAAATADSDSKEKVEEADSPCDSEIKAAAADYDSKEKAEEEADSQSNHFFVKCSISTAAVKLPVNNNN